MAAYVTLAQSFPDFQKFLDSPSAFTFRAAAATLQQHLDALHCELPLRLSFSTQVVVVRNQASQHGRGTVAEPNGQDFNLLVLTRLEGIRGASVLALLSSTGPARTSIFVLDDALGARLLYDSIAQSAAISPPLGMTTNVQLTGTRILWRDSNFGIPSRTYQLTLKTLNISQAPSN